MAVSSKYGKVDIPRIGDDEPVFILRAQDILAEGMIEIYKVLTKFHKTPVMKGLDDEILKFHEWTGKKKLPD